MAKKEAASPLAVLADKYYKAREERLVLKRKCDALEENEKALKEELKEALLKAKVQGVRGKVGRADLKDKDIFMVEDEDKFHAYIKKNNAWDLLQKKLVESAVAARFDDKKPIPGVKKDRIVVLSTGKA